jgi:protein TonB
MFHPTPPPPKVDQVKFVKPVVAKAEEVTEEPPKIRLKKKLAETIRRSRCSFVVVSGPGPTKIVEEDNQIYNTAGIEVKPEFPVWLNSTSMWEITIELLKKKVLEEKFT